MREIRTTLLPNGEQQVQAGGDFVYVDYVDREIKLMIHDQIITVNPGDKVRPARPFKSVTVINPDDTNPVAVVLKVGEGDYNSQIIRGEVTVNPGIRQANGQWVDDTRSELELSVVIGSIEDRRFVRGDQVSQYGVPLQCTAMTVVDDSRLVLMKVSGTPQFKLATITGETLVTEDATKFGDGQGVRIGNELFFPAGQPGQQGGVLVLNVYDVATLGFKRAVVTEAPWLSPYPSNPSIGAAATDGGSVFVASSGGGAGAIYKLNPKSGDVMAVHAWGVGSSNVGAMACRNGRLHTYANDSSSEAALVVYDAETLEVMADSESYLPEQPASGFREMAYDVEKNLLWRAVGNSGIETQAVRDFRVSASGSVSSCEAAGTIKQNRKETRAEVQGNRLPGGRVVLSGQVLRAILEIYTGRIMPDNYLDYIYKVEAESMNGISPNTISSGGQSFAGAGFADDAFAEFPQTVQITVRKGLI